MRMNPKPLDRGTAKQTVRFLFSLWRISPILTPTMVLTQTIFALLTSLVAPVFISQLLTHITNGTATLQTSTWLLVGYAGVLFVGEVIVIRLTVVLSYLTETKMQAITMQRVMKHLTAKSLGYHANRMTGGTISDATKLNGSIERFWDTLVYTIVPIATTLVAVCITLTFIFWQYALILAALSLIVIVIVVRIQASIAPLSRKVAETSSASTAYFSDVISNMSAVKAFAQEETEQRTYEEHINKWRQANRIEMKRVLVVTMSFGFMMTFLNVAAFAAAVYATQYHLAPIGVVYLVISYTLNVVSQLWSVSFSTRAFIRILGDAAPMITALEDPIELTDPESPETTRMHKGKIEFRDVTFTHDETEHALFHKFQLTIPAGQRVGLVGHSGSGKSSLTRLLLRFSDIDSGTIAIDGQDIRSVAQADLHRAIAYVPQEPILFHRSLRDNIAYGAKDATEDDIVRAAKLANAMEFIESLPQGFDTMVGERGVKLSGGQRQRIAIARAIIKNAPILVLDEATSALDSESEKLIQEALTNLMKGRTSIVVAHRLSTIAKLDRILVLDHGHIAEDGTHEELLQQKGIYARLWAHQSGGFIEE